ncbi:hypothetical protein C8J56DRAFT_897995 [Mycena floridula]|nr:hypothetical protein C8J56DRAFT_897995 [Mycena floridula]
MTGNLVSLERKVRKMDKAKYTFHIEAGGTDIQQTAFNEGYQHIDSFHEMPARNKDQAKAAHLNARRSLAIVEPDVNQENIAPPSHIPPALSKKPAKKTQKQQLLEKDVKIADLQSQISVLEDSTSRLNQDLLEHRETIETFNRQNNALSIQNLTLSSSLRLKRKTETNLSSELSLKQKQQALVDKNHHIAHLDKSLASSDLRAASLDITVASLHSQLKKKQESINETQKRLYAFQKQAGRAQSSLKQLRCDHNAILVWNPTQKGEYTVEAQRLARDLTFAGCAGDKVKLAIRSCAETFGIKVGCDIRGKYSEIQIGREIMNTQALIDSSDGTTHRGITVESRFLTYSSPSYAPGIDDSDPETWSPRTRFLKVAPALDHMAERQVQGTKDAITRVADVYSRSPVAARDGKTMELDDYYRKKVGEVKDHAADGKKGFKISKERKKTVVHRDLGQEALEDHSMSPEHIMNILLQITDKELEVAGKISSEQLAALSPVERLKLMQSVLEYKLGQERFDTLPTDKQKLANTHVFGGCCCHKDLNVVKYDIIEMQAARKAANLRAPVLLANKANDALCHKDGERGYQDRCVIFMKEQKSALFELDEGGKQPDTSNIRYQSYTYAAAEVICFHGIIYELIKEIVDAKAKSGHPNHVESNVLKALDDPATLSELGALFLYGASVSWPYMTTVRSTKEKPVNLLDLTDIHRKLPDFCENISKNPHILLDPTTSPEQLTINARPFDDHILIESIRILVPETSNLFFNISHMFAGAAKGWIRFTPEFHVGGTFDLLTPEQRKLLFIPSTNDHNEDQKYVMREVWIFGASGQRAKFRKAYAALQREKAEKALQRCKKTAAKKLSTELQISSINLELDVSVIMKLSSAKLKDQLHVYHDVLKDPVLVKKLWKDMALVDVRRAEVLAALTRELARQSRSDGTSVIDAEPCNDAPESMIIDDYGYTVDQDQEWEDIETVDSSD